MNWIWHCRLNIFHLTAKQKQTHFVAWSLTHPDRPRMWRHPGNTSLHSVHTIRIPGHQQWCLARGRCLISICRGAADWRINEIIKQMFEYFVTKVFLAGYTPWIKRKHSLSKFTVVLLNIPQTPQETRSANKWGGSPQHVQNMPDKCAQRENFNYTVSPSSAPMCSWC